MFGTNDYHAVGIKYMLFLFHFNGEADDSLKFYGTCWMYGKLLILKDKIKWRTSQSIERLNIS